jgi:competence protein ComEA
MKYFLRCVVFMLAVFSFSSPVFAANPEPAAVQKQVAVAEGKTVNLNTADTQTIVNAHIKGIGKKRAEAIVAYRGQHGPFKSVDDLKNIKGISENIINANRNRLTLE